MTTARDCFWLWGHEAGSYTNRWNFPGVSRMTPMEAAGYMELQNLLMVRFGNRPEPPFAQYTLSFSPLKKVVWSIVGDSSTTSNDKAADLDEVISLAPRFPNVCGGIMDDFFHPPDAGGAFSRWSVADLRGFRQRLHAAVRPLDLWVVLYAHDLGLPVREYLAECDVVTFWTWYAKDVLDLESNFARCEAAAPGPRKVLGCYMWDFGVGAPMPIAAMEKQCTLGLQWLEQGRIDGMIFLASCFCDLEIETVEWTRNWIRQNGDRPVR